MSSNVAFCQVPELNGGFDRKLIKQNLGLSIPMFDYQRVIAIVIIDDLTSGYITLI